MTGMDPYTTAVLGTLKSGFEFGSKLLEFWSTPEGQKHFAKLQADQAKMEAFLKPFSDAVQGLLTGDLFKPKPKVQ